MSVLAVHVLTPARRRQSGIVLVTAMLFLVILTMIGLSLFRSSGLMDRISANTRDKERAFESAQAALQYGEWWLKTNQPGMTTSACSSIVSGNVSTNVHVCQNPLGIPTTLAWPNGFSYTPLGMNVNTAGGLNGNDVNYLSLPGFYLEYEGTVTNGTGYAYRVTAYGSGGNVNTASVVRSTYQIVTPDDCRMCSP
jgi:type IV pilus assembly protein PilX